MADVVSIGGGPVPEPGKPNDVLIAALADLLERAKSGDVVGLAGGLLHGDKSTSWLVAGRCGGYGHMGALDMVRDRLLTINKGLTEEKQ